MFEARSMACDFGSAGVVEAVDTEDLKSSGGNPVRVRVPPPAFRPKTGGWLIAWIDSATRARTGIRPKAARWEAWRRRYR